MERNDEENKMKWNKNQKGIDIDLKDVHPNIANPRKGKYDKRDMVELKDSMESLGQLTVIKIDENGMILSGHRRHHAAKELGWKTIKADVIVGLTQFGKSAVMISENTTQRQFNAWDSRQAIADIYWNLFCEEYSFRDGNDKGYTEFAKRLGISVLTARKCIESMSKDNQSYARKLKNEGLGIEIIDTILEAPKKHRQELFSKAMEISKRGKTTGIREQLRMYKKSLNIDSKKEELHPSFFVVVINKIDAVGLCLTKDVIERMDANTKIKVKAAIEKSILPAYKRMK